MVPDEIEQDCGEFLSFILLQKMACVTDRHVPESSRAGDLFLESLLEAARNRVAVTEGG